MCISAFASGAIGHLPHNQGEESHWETFNCQGTELAFRLDEMAKRLFLQEATYRALCSKGRWDLAIPPDLDTFVNRWLHEMNGRLTHEQRLEETQIELITNLWTCYQKRFILDYSIPIPSKTKSTLFYVQDKHAVFVQLPHLLGTGATSKVWLGWDCSTGNACACAVYEEEQFYKNHLETSDLFTLHQPLVYASSLKFRAIFQESFDCDLAKAIQMGLLSSFEKQKNVALQLLHILKDIHPSGTHRDLKPQNALFKKEDGRVKLTDFEIFTKHNDIRKKSLPSGTCTHMSPEFARKIQNKEPYDSCIEPSYDIFTLGMIFHELFFSSPGEKIRFPWFVDEKSIDDKRKAVQHVLKTLSTYASEHWMKEEPKNKKSVSHLIWRMTHYDPLERPPAQEALDLLFTISEL
ncbi:MAG: protein kinase [Verrucomicrobiota bacterium]|nr:protein kinase [Verrucomicrobiota bacterium]